MAGEEDWFCGGVSGRAGRGRRGDEDVECKRDAGDVAEAAAWRKPRVDLGDCMGGNRVIAVVVAWYGVQRCHQACILQMSETFSKIVRLTNYTRSLCVDLNILKISLHASGC